MKNTTTKKSILSKLALIAIMSLTVSYTYTNPDNNKDKITQLRKTFGAVENHLSEFVSVKSKAPFNDILVRIKARLQGLQRSIEELTRNHSGDLSKEIDELMDYALQQFSVLYNIFTKYNGKPDSQALNFAGEIKKEFDTDKIFSTMIAKLKVLKVKADQEGDKALVEEIVALIGEIEKKNKIWNAKSNLELFGGLAHRMKC